MCSQYHNWLTYSNRIVFESLCLQRATCSIFAASIEQDHKAQIVQSDLGWDILATKKFAVTMSGSPKLTVSFPYN